MSFVEVHSICGLLTHFPSVRVPQSSGSTILKDVLVYLLVFAVDDRRSFEYVSKLLQVLSKVTSDQLVMLVGNKADLVRCRSVPNESK